MRYGARETDRFRIARHRPRLMPARQSAWRASHPANERDFNEGLLAASHSSPEHPLLEAPELRLAGKAVAEVASLEYGMPSTPESREVLTTKEQLWSSLEETLGDVASLRSAASVKHLLWLRIAQDLDKQAWDETCMTAHDLLSAADYGLVRKIIADGLAETIINCVGLGPNFCKLTHDTTMNWCEVLDAACLVAFSRRQVDICECKADLRRRL